MITNEEQLKNLYRQLNEIQQTILTRENGARYAMPAEAEVIKKLTIAIKQLQTELGLSEITSVFAGLIQFLRTFEPARLKDLTPLLDAYVKSKLA